jgi:hypothetical protein
MCLTSDWPIFFSIIRQFVVHVYMILDVQYMCITFSRMVDVPYLYSPHFFTKKVLQVVHVHVYTQLVYFYYNMYL